jgi:hypothetical protein
MQRTHGLWILAAAALGAGGCGSNVVFEEHEPSGLVCFPGPGPGDTPVDLRTAAPGTFVGDLLHLDGTVDGSKGYFIVRIEAGMAFVVAQPDLRPPAKLVPIGADLHARAPSGFAVKLEVVDTSSPLDPVIAAEHTVGGVMPEQFEGVIGARDGHVYFCHAPDPDGDPSLVGVDLGDPFAPGEPISIDPLACGEPFTHATSEGKLWVAWTPGEADFVTQISGLELRPTGAAGTGIDWAYEPGGAHDYGLAKAVATDGTRVVVDVESDAWMLVFGTADSFEAPYAAFPLPGPKQLLAVADQVAYFATPDGVHAIDVSYLHAPLLLDFHAEGVLEPATTRTIAIDRRYLVIADAFGRVYVVDRQAPGVLAPVTAYLGEPSGSGDCR